MLTPRPQLSIVIPIYHEQENVETVIPRVVQSLAGQGRLFEIIAVNDGSRDRTGEILDRLAAGEPRLRVIHLARNFGQTAAMMAGFLAARGDVIVPMDGDGQNDPDDVKLLVDKLEEGHDVVSGWRRDRKDSWHRILVSRCANGLISWITGVKLHDYGCTLKAYRAATIRDSRLFGEMHRFIPVYTSMHGARICEMVVRHHPRVAGKSKYGYGRIVKVLLDLLLVRLLQKYRTKPIHFFGKITQWTWLGTLMCFVFAVGNAIYSRNPWAAFWGKAPLVGLLLFVLGFVAIMAGLVAELVMRAGFEFNAGRYWDELRRVNFGPAVADSTTPRALPADELLVEARFASPHPREAGVRSERATL
ncbi:MAG: glycosyltransferase family 2 protein [Phycisphaerae bacterium]